MFECPGCEAKLKKADLIWPIPDVEEIVLPGELMPEGLCPECGTPVYADAEELD